MMTQNAEQQYIDLFLQERGLIDSHSCAALNQLREQAFEDFKRLGFPTKKDERYKYTDVAAAFAPNYGLNLSRLEIPTNPRKIQASPGSLTPGPNTSDAARLLATFKCEVPNLSTSLYFIANDQFYDKALPAAQLPDGVFVGSLQALATEPRGTAASVPGSVVAGKLGSLARTSKDAINALNTMLAQDALVIYVPRNTIVERPIQIINILHSPVDLMVNRRVLIVLEQGAEAKILFCDHAMDDHDFLATQVAEVFLGENAHLELYELEETHTRSHRFANTYIDVARNATVTAASITLHNGLTRNRTDVTLSGEGAGANLQGCVIADKEQHVDNNTLIDHRAPGGTSHELYKYVLDDKAVGAFAGRVLVREGAQKTTSTETNANLCATRTARMYTQPMLEIYADDVKCSHGSTVGQLNEQALFYMRQRGIPEAEARLLLKYAFLGQVLDSISLAPLRDRLRYLVEKRFRGELNKCEGCKLCK